MRSPRADHGFTLIELMLVLAIVAIMVGMAAVSVRNQLPTTRLNGVNRDIYAAFQQARSRAIKTNRTHKLCIYDATIAPANFRNGYQILACRNLPGQACTSSTADRVACAESPSGVVAAVTGGTSNWAFPVSIDPPAGSIVTARASNYGRQFIDTPGWIFDAGGGPNGSTREAFPNVRIAGFIDNAGTAISIPKILEVAFTPGGTIDLRTTSLSGTNPVTSGGVRVEVAGVGQPTQVRSLRWTMGGSLRISR